MIGGFIVYEAFTSSIYSQMEEIVIDAFTTAVNEISKTWDGQYDLGGIKICETTQAQIVSLAKKING